MIGKSLKALAALLALLLLALAVYVWRSFPALDGEMRAPGLAACAWCPARAVKVSHGAA